MVLIPPALVEEIPAEELPAEQHLHLRTDSWTVRIVEIICNFNFFFSFLFLGDGNHAAVSLIPVQG
jgi:hypothetical protein